MTSTLSAADAGAAPVLALAGAAALPVATALGATRAGEPTAAEDDAAVLVEPSADGPAARSFRGARHALLVQARPTANAIGANRLEPREIAARSLLC